MQNHRSNTGALVGGTLLTAFGLLSLADRFFHGFNWGLLWPFMVVGVGILFFAAMFAGGKQAAGLAIPGSIVSGVGLVLFFQNITRHWESASYIWTLIILFVGVGIYIMGIYSNDAGQKKSGITVIKVGLILFVIFGSFFELVFSSFGNLTFPILLILPGVYLVLSRSGLVGRRKDTASDSVPPIN